MNDRAKPNPRLRQALIVAVCVLAVLLFLYLLLRDRPGSANDYLDDSAPYAVCACGLGSSTQRGDFFIGTEIR